MSTTDQNKYLRYQRHQVWEKRKEEKERERRLINHYEGLADTFLHYKMMTFMKWG